MSEINNKSIDKERKMIVKLTSKDKKKAINLFKKNTWNEFNKQILETISELKEKKYIINFVKDSKFKFAPVFDEETFQDFYNYVIKKYEENNEDFSSKNAPLIETKIVENYPEKINYSKILEKALDQGLNNMRESLKKLFNEETLKKMAKIYETKNDNKENEKKVIHNNIICNNCYSKDFNGPRFICAECENFNLCEKCEKMNVHFPNHVLIQYNLNVSNEDYYLYQNIIKENEQILTINLNEIKEGKINLDVTVCNNGLKSFSKCFFSPISFGNNALFGKRLLIEEKSEEITSGQKTTFKITLDNIKSEGNYYSKWRMFTPEGLPFGKVLYLNIRII
jgi:hypothetical protein